MATVFDIIFANNFDRDRSLRFWSDSQFNILINSFHATSGSIILNSWSFLALPSSLWKADEPASLGPKLWFSSINL